MLRDRLADLRAQRLLVRYDTGAGQRGGRVVRQAGETPARTAIRPRVRWKETFRTG
ncbi:hypothetical protein SALBM135S_02781 [Streptomyces alboniger]